MLAFRALVCITLYLSSAFLFPSASVGKTTIGAADYVRATRVLDSSLRHAVKNGYVDAHWMGDEGRFWYQRQGANGPECILVNAKTGTRTIAFDNIRLSRGLTKIVAVDRSSEMISDFTKLSAVDGTLHLTLETVTGKIFECALDDYSCAPNESHRNAMDLYSPDGQSQVFLRKNNLWLRDKDGIERALTTDGEDYFAYGKLPDDSLRSLPTLRDKKPAPPVRIEWSPDGKYLFGVRRDEREILPYPYVEWVPQDGSFRPVTYFLRIALPGDAGQAREQAFVIEVYTGSKHVINLSSDLSFAESGMLAWSKDGKKAYRVAYGYGNRRMALFEVDLLNGQTRTVVDDVATTTVIPNNLIYSASNIRVLLDTNEVIWFSERDGWGHLYLYDLRDGHFKRTLTSGAWLVRDLIHVDPHSRHIWFTATGREPGRDLYYRQLYRGSLDGGKLSLLTPENAEHQIESPLPATIAPVELTGTAFSPDGQYFVDTYSTVSTPPKTLLRSATDGRVIMTLEEADASEVAASGWSAPLRFSAKSADGVTDLYGVIYLPPNFERSQNYPVIDAFYGGPQWLNAPRSYSEAVSAFNPISRASLAQLGFIVTTIDARGTRGRSKTFADIGYGNFADPQIEDHIAVIRQLAERYGGFDLDRVGVYGHSFGGYTSARAILKHPEFYKVAVSSAGPHNYQGFYEGLEALIGLPDYGGGVRIRPTPQSVPENYKIMDNSTLASNLRGKLMLTYGDMDENALPAVTFQLIDALEKANKSFDLVYLPNRTHGYFRADRYYTRRMWDYFVEHLLGLRPPEDFALDSKTSD